MGRITGLGICLAVIAALAMAAPLRAQNPPAAPSAAAPAQAPNSAHAVVVLDSSASMLAPLETFKKYYLVRKNLQIALGTPPTGVDVGLFAYGFRRRSACDDYDVLAPIQPFDVRTFFRGLMSVRPRGQSALAGALTAAGAMLGADGRKGGKLLLIAGSPDSCQADPCAAAGALAAADPELRIDVVWLVTPGQDMAQAQCIAKAGRGRLFSATTMAEAEKMMGEAFAALSAPALPKAGEMAAAPAGSGPGLKLSVRLAAGGEAFAGKVAWAIRTSMSGSDNQKVIARADQPNVFLPLPAGTYDVEVAAAGIVRRQTEEVGPDKPRELALSLDAGLVQMAPAGTATAADTFVTIYRLGAEGGDAPETVAVLPLSAEPVLLPEGDYRLAASRSGLRIERSLKVAAGSRPSVDFSLQTGQIQVEFRRGSRPDCLFRQRGRSRGTPGTAGRGPLGCAQPGLRPAAGPLPRPRAHGCASDEGGCRG